MRAVGVNTAVITTWLVRRSGRGSIGRGGGGGRGSGKENGAVPAGCDEVLVDGVVTACSSCRGREREREKSVRGKRKE
jgi:hypothetical protein